MLMQSNVDNNQTMKLEGLGVYFSSKNILHIVTVELT